MSVGVHEGAELSMTKLTKWLVIEVFQPFYAGSDSIKLASN